MIRDPRRFIVVELMYSQGVQLICLDCPEGNGMTTSVGDWPNEGASLMEMIISAEEHEEKKH